MVRPRGFESLTCASGGPFSNIIYKWLTDTIVFCQLEKPMNGWLNRKNASIVYTTV